jgi:hypothetical protein
MSEYRRPLGGFSLWQNTIGGHYIGRGVSQRVADELRAPLVAVVAPDAELVILLVFPCLQRLMNASAQFRPGGSQRCGCGKRLTPPKMAQTYVAPADTHQRLPPAGICDYLPVAKASVRPSGPPTGRIDSPTQHRVAPLEAMFRLAGMQTIGPLCKAESMLKVTLCAA